jgi:hypothetical protein
MDRFGGAKPDAPPQLKPSDLFEKRRQRDGAKLKSYNKILEQIYLRIKASSREGGEPWIIYTVPQVIIGNPLISLEDCIVYLVYILRQQGYDVRYTYPNLLYISWKHHEKDYIVKGSPIMQTMLAAAQSTKPKTELRAQSGARVKFADQVMAAPFGGGGGAGGPPRPQTVGRAPPRSVNQYQPPASFLNVLETGPVAEPRKSALDDFMNF